MRMSKSEDLVNFLCERKKQKKGRNPQSGDNLTLGVSRVVIFQCSGFLRYEVNVK